MSPYPPFKPHSCYISNEGYRGMNGKWDASFHVVVTGSYSFGVIFQCTHEVLKRIVEEQDKFLEQLDAGNDFTKLELVDDQTLRVSSGEPGTEYYESGEHKRGADGNWHDLNFGWVWYEVQPKECLVAYDKDGVLIW